MTNIYVGNLSLRTTQGHLHAMFCRFGNVERVSLVMDPYNGQPRGFAFFEMTQANEAQKAISELKDTALHGRKLSVSEARPEPRGARKSSRGDSW
jgi:RNA recognition motif-containing protein